MYATRSSDEPDREARHVSKTFPPSSQRAKRKRTADDSTAIIRTPKTKKTRNLGPIFDQGLDLENGVNTAIGTLDSHLLADYVAQKTKRFDDNLTMVELEERRIPGTAFETLRILRGLDLHRSSIDLGSGKAFRNTIEWAGERTLQSLPAFIEHFSSKGFQTKDLSVASEKKGAPHTIVVTSAGLRAADITRALRTFQTSESVVAKLFAKHIKLRDAVKHVTST
ncbi:MAG: hypothetical protein Q9187_003037, partial [Circinaria calcarea]